MIIVVMIVTVKGGSMMLSIIEIVKVQQAIDRGDQGKALDVIRSAQDRQDQSQAQAIYDLASDRDSLIF
jgi:hypothetical protein